MGLKSFFSKVANGVKNGATKVWNTAKKVGGYVGRVAKPILKLAPTALTGLAALPGKVGMVGKLISPFTNVLNGLIDKIPDGKAKDKVNELYDKTKDLANDVEKKAVDMTTRVSDATNKWIPFVEHMNGLIK